MHNKNIVTMENLTPVEVYQSNKSKGFHKITVEGKEVEVYYRSFDSNYVVYKNKLWRITSKYSMGVNHVIGMERPNAGEKVSVKGDDLKTLLYVTNPTGYISL